MLELPNLRYMFRWAGKIMPEVEKVQGELLFLDKKQLLFHNVGRKKGFSEGNKYSQISNTKDKKSFHVSVCDKSFKTLPSFVHHLTTENDFPLPKDMDIRKNALEKSKTARLGQSKKVQHQ